MPAAFNTEDFIEEQLRNNQCPKLVISVIGDSVGFVPKQWPKYRFKKALIHTIKTFGDSLVLCECRTTPENACRVTKIVTESMREYELIPDMKDPPTASLFGFLNKEDKDDVDVLKNKNITKLRLDNCSAKNQNKVMAEIEHSLSKEFVNALNMGETFKMKLPVVLVVVEGDLDTIDHVLEAVQKDIPVVLVKGSGMAADLIHYCLEELENFTEKAPLLFGVCFDQGKYEKLKANIENIVKPKKWLLTSFDVNEDSPEVLADKVMDVILGSWAMLKIRGDAAGKINADVDIYNEIMSDTPPPATYIPPQGGKKNQVTPTAGKYSIASIVTIHLATQRLKSAVESRKTANSAGEQGTSENTGISRKDQNPSPLAFYLFYQMLQDPNVIEDITKEKGKDDKMKTMYDHLMTKALVAGRHDFVEVLMDRKKLSNFDINLKDLYRVIDGEELTKILKKDSWREDYEEAAQKRLRIILRYNQAKEVQDGHKQEKNVEQNEILKHLLWAVQTNQRKMAELFWKKTDYPILTALIASAFLRKLSKKAMDQKELVLKDDLESHAQIFSQRAIDVADRFYKGNHQNAIDALTTRQACIWGIYMTPIDFAQRYRIYDFVADHVAQRSFNAVWYGSAKRPTWKHVYCVCCTGQNNRCFSLGNMKNVLISPLTRFCVHYLLFIMYLICLSAFVLSNLKEVMPMNERSVYEYMTYLWITGDFVEEYMSAVWTIWESNWKKPWKCLLAWRREMFLYLDDFWNLLDLVGYGFMIAAVAFRFQQKEEYEDITRQLFSATMFIMYMRFLHVLLVDRKIGPTIIMLKEALKELIRFMLILSVFIVSTGVFYHANLYPNHYDLFSQFGIRYWSIWRIIYLPFWAIFGEFKEELEGIADSTCSSNETVYVNDRDIERCPEKDFLVSIMSGAFATIASLLLVNLIIAMFTFRFEEIKLNSDKLWRYYRSTVIKEFEYRIPSPFNLPVRALGPVIYLFKKIPRKAEPKGNDKNTEIQRTLAERWEG